MMTLEGQCQKRARHDEVSTPAEDWAKQFQTLICKSTAPIFFNPYCLFLNFARKSLSRTHLLILLNSLSTFWNLSHV